MLFVEVGPLLAERGYRVLSIAAPGAGETPAFDDPDAGHDIVEDQPVQTADLVAGWLAASG